MSLNLPSTVLSTDRVCGVIRCLCEQYPLAIHYLLPELMTYLSQILRDRLRRDARGKLRP